MRIRWIIYLVSFVLESSTPTIVYRTLFNLLTYKVLSQKTFLETNIA